MERRGDEKAERKGEWLGGYAGLANERKHCLVLD